MKIKSIHLGKKKTVEFQGKAIETGIFKSQVNGPVLLKTLNLVGDEQADLRVHGGRDKALYAYPLEAYFEWKKLRPQDQFENGAMGENLTVEGLPENEIYIGDIFEVGQATIQVTQPRFPCHKLGVKFKDPGILKQFMELGRPGVYFRVLKEGLIDVGQSLKLIDREKTLLSIVDLFYFQSSNPDPLIVKAALKVKALPESWKTKFESLSQTE